LEELAPVEPAAVEPAALLPGEVAEVEPADEVGATLFQIVDDDVAGAVVCVAIGATACETGPDGELA
jgi:hypothetical protein